MDFIAKKFNEIKESFKEQISKCGLKFDEDVYSQTIIQCNEKITENMFEIDMLRYFWTSFKNNTLRELKYMRNKTSDEIPEYIIQDNYDVDEEFNNVSLLIIKEFGEEIYQLFALHANGKPYSELEKLTNITNLKYKFRCVREYIRKNYKREWEE